MSQRNGYREDRSGGRGSALLVCLFISFSIACSDSNTLRAKAFFGDASSQVALGRLYREGTDGVDKDWIKASELFRKAAESGDADGQSWLAVSYWYGVGVERDAQQAVQLALAASEQDHPRAQYNLAEYYERQDKDRKSLMMYKKAANNGHANAQAIVGDRYFFGNGVPENEAEAIEWYMKAHEQGHAGAAYQLGKIHRHGWGVEQNYEEAARFFHVAVDRGKEGAKAELGPMYWFGMGVAKDPARAVMWLTLAIAEKGETKDGERGVMERILGEIQESVPSEQFEEGRRLALEWDQEHSEPSEAELKARSLHGVKV